MRVGQLLASSLFVQTQYAEVVFEMKAMAVFSCPEGRLFCGAAV